MIRATVTSLVIKVGVPIALVFAVLYGVDRYVNREARNTVLTILLVFVAVLLVLWLIIWLVRKLISSLSAARARKDTAQAAAAPTGLGAQERSELTALNENLNTALKVIRESKLAKGRKADEALYAIPWVLLLGPSNAGKTTALKESGVDFAYTTADARSSRRGTAGAGCEYWFSRGAIALDLIGRIAAGEDDFEIFKGFLDQLKKARSRRPIDGVVVTVSLAEILQQSAEQSELLANTLRQRFDEMIRRLGIRFPIYVLFTKCDQVDGFQEFFANFRTRDRAQVWGATISRDQRRQMPAEQIFVAEFDRLASALSSYRLPLLASEKDSSKLPRIFGFPTRFASFQKRLEDFLGALLQPTPYSERPMFRGFYFAGASATAANDNLAAPQEPVLQWDPDRRQPAVAEPAAQGKSYFLENLFQRIIFADQSLVKASVDTRLKRRLWMDIAFFGTLALSAILLVGMIYSFSENRALIESTRLVGLRLTDAGWDGRRTADLMALQQLRDRVAQLEGFEAGGPRWTLRWGLYSGDSLIESSRRVYLRRLRESFVAPTAAALQKKLYAYATGAETVPSYGEFYSYLKAYLMMAEPSRAEASFLVNSLAPVWKRLAPPDSEAVALDQLRFYADQLPKNRPELRMTSDTNVISVARRALSQYPPIERIFTRLKDEGNRKYQPFTLAQATGGKSLEYLNSSHDVPGVFTEAGWSGYFKNAVAAASKEAVQDDWVLGSAGRSFTAVQTSDADYDRLLRDKYFLEYIDEWQKFLEGVSVRSLADLTEGRAALDSLSQQDSALSRLLMSVAANTMLRKEPEKGTSISSLFSSALATLGLSTRINRTELVDTVVDQFQPLHDLVTSPDGGKTASMLAQYIASLGKVQIRLESLFGAGTQWDQVKAYVDTIANNLSSNEFQESYRLAALANRQCTTRSTRAIGPLLEQPLRQTWASILRDAGYRLDGLWRTQISDNFKRDLGNNFPFNNSGRDVSLSALTQFLKSKEGILDTFYDKELKMFLVPAGDGYAPRTLISGQVAFSPTFLSFLEKLNIIRQSLYPPGTPEIGLTFDLTPDSTPGVTESLLEVDAQRLRYRNETPTPYTITWPSKSGAPQAKLSVALEGSGERPGIQGIEGEWAFFRLLAQARVTVQSQTTYTATWSLPGADGRRREVRYKLQARSFRNPFTPNLFTGVVCPERVTQLPTTSQSFEPAR
jgi:type VI secretion system protein ImpL